MRVKVLAYSDDRMQIEVDGKKKIVFINYNTINKEKLIEQIRKRLSLDTEVENSRETKDNFCKSLVGKSLEV